MSKTILITGATDGIGLETAKMLVEQKQTVLLHGRNPDKLETILKTLSAEGGKVEQYVADLSRINDVESLAKAVSNKHPTLDVLINNAGVYSTNQPMTPEGLDIRFVVNAIAPYFLTQRLLPRLGTSGRVLNVSSAAQSTINSMALAGHVQLSDSAAYAQSKLALTMWSRALSQKEHTPSIIAVNPGSMLGSKMVKQAYGVTGGDIRKGAKILCRAALTDEFADVSGQYFDNDTGQFASPHPDALNPQKSQEIIQGIETVLANMMQSQNITS